MPVIEPRVTSVAELEIAPDNVVSVSEVCPKASELARSKPRVTRMDLKFFMVFVSGSVTFRSHSGRNLLLGSRHDYGRIIGAQIAESVAHVKAVGNLAVELIPGRDERNRSSRVRIFGALGLFDRLGNFKLSKGFRKGVLGQIERCGT